MESYKFSLDKYSKWEDDEWQSPITNTKKDKLSIIIQDGHLLVVKGSKALESMSLLQPHSNLNVLQDECCLVIGNQFQDICIRFRIIFKTKKKTSQCMSILKKYFSVYHVSGIQIKQKEHLTMPQLLRQIIQENPKLIKAPLGIPEDYPLDTAVKLCILDPGFPKLIDNIENIINGFTK